MMNNKVKGIYIHIPFCQDICYYCDFCKVFYEKDLADKYLKQLEAEFNSFNINHDEIESIYIGGGSPSALSFEQLEYLFSIVNVSRYSNLKEFTIEVNPEQLTVDKIKLLAQNKINRVSIGVQTFNDKLLKSLNRHHTKNDILKAIFDLRKQNINNISIDLMYGFTNQTFSDIKADLMMIKELEIKHVSVYSLIIEEGSVFKNSDYQINEYESEFNDYIESYLIDELKFEHYEVSNYALDNSYSRHNLLYWNNEKYFGIGLGASGYLNDYRYYNTKSITNYLKGQYNRSYDYYKSVNDYLKDEILLKFRLFNGIDLNEMNDKYSINFTKYFENVIISNINRVYIRNNKLFFTKEGKRFLNDIIIDFIYEVKE